MADGAKIKLYKKVVAMDGSGPTTLRQLFTVYVINRSDWDIAFWNIGGGTGWYKLDPPIGTNCHSDCNECWDEGHYAKVHSFPSNADPFDLHLKARRGEDYRDYTVRITPSPNAKGIAICLPIPT